MKQVIMRDGQFVNIKTDNQKPPTAEDLSAVDCDTESRQEE